MEVEVHVFGFSVAANVLLSFFPFLLVLVWFSRSIGWDSAEQAVYFAMSDVFGKEVEAQIRHGINWIPNRFAHFNYTSLLLLLFTANGIFEPMEVALNKCWGVKKHRNFLMNQVVSMGLIFACGTLALLSIVLSALNFEALKMTDGTALGKVMGGVYVVFFRTAALVVLMVALFLVYWILPNTKVAWQRVVPVSVVVGIVLEAFKYLLRWIWPTFLRKLQVEYGPFYWSVIIVLVSFFASMIVLAGAEWASRGAEEGAIGEPQNASHSTSDPPHKS